MAIVPEENDLLSNIESHASLQSESELEIYKHFDKFKVREQLQDILGSMMRNDVTSIDLIKNNALTFNGVLGPELAFLKDKVF